MSKSYLSNYGNPLAFWDYVLNHCFDCDFPEEVKESKFALESDDKRTQISYSIPGVDKSQLRVYVSNDNTEDGDSELIVEISPREGGGLGAEQKRESFKLFSYDDVEKISTSLKNGVMTIVIPKRDPSSSQRVIREIEVQ